MNIINTITYTMPRGVGSQPIRYEQTAREKTSRRLTATGAQRILRRRLGIKPGTPAYRGPIVVRVEYATES